MKGKQRADSLFKDYSQRKVSKAQTYSGVLGITTGGKAVVKVTGRNNFVWVRLRNATNEVIQAFNDAVSNTYDLPVLVQYDPANPVRYRIVGRDVGRYSDWGWRGTQLPPHGGSHSFTFDNSGGGDMVWVYSRQIMPYLIAPSGSVGQLGGVIYPHYYYDVNTFRWFGATGTPNLSPYKPTDDQARMVLLVLDTDSGNVYVATGTSSDFTATITGNALVAQYIPPLPDNNDIPLAAVRLLSGTSTIQWANIYDVRPFFYPPSAGGGAPSNAQYVVMALDGSLTNERVLVSGSDIKITDEGANANVVISVATGVFSRTDHTHPGGSGDNVLPIYDDNVFSVTGSAISFNENLAVAVTGSIAYISSTATGEGINVLPIFDDGVFKVSGTAVDFTTDLDVSVTGTTAYVGVPTGTFSRASHTHLSSDAHDVSVYDDSIFKVTGTILDFTNDLDVSVTGTVGYIGIPTGTFSRPGDHTHTSSDNHDVAIYDDHVFKVTGTILDFTDNIEVAITGSVAFISSTASGGGGNLVFYDDGVFVATGTAIDFEDNLTAVATGTSIFVSATGGPDWVINEDHSSQCNGSATYFATNGSFATGSTIVSLNGLIQRPGADEDYLESGIVGVEFSVAPLAGDNLLISYIKGALGASWETVPSIKSIPFIIDGGGSVISTGTKGDLPIEYSCTLNQWTLLTDATGTVQIDVWKSNYANFPPTNANSITNGNEPRIYTGTKAQDTDLSDWSDVTVDAGDIFRFYVDNCSAITRVTLSFKATRI